MLLDSPPKELSMTVIGVQFKTVHEKSSLKGVSRGTKATSFSLAGQVAYCRSAREWVNEPARRLAEFISTLEQPHNVSQTALAAAAAFSQC